MNDTQCSVDGCSDQPFIEHPLPLCRRDALTVSLNVTDVLHATALMGHTTPGLDIERVSVADGQVWQKPSHQPVVYFLANGDRVKIGVSTNIAARVTTLSFRKEHALLLLQGGYDLEASLHEHFQADRIARTEWFVLSDRIRDYIGHRKKADAALRQPQMPADGASETPVVPEPRKKPASADEKILKVLNDFSDPISLETIYTHKDQIAKLTRLEGSTLDNALTRLTKAGKIHRQVQDGKEVRGTYGLGPTPEKDSHNDY